MRRAAAVVLPLAAVLVLALWRDRGPAPRGTHAPDSQFSAMRAMATLRALLAEQVPHPVATAANARVRERIVARFRELGYRTTVQRRFACNAAAVCAVVENIIAADGPLGPHTVLLVAHYDSVAAGMGASDDGSGTAAVLEVARALRGRRFRNPVAFLITDGEEQGLIGAEAFVADEALARNVAAVVNVEMRGTYGASNMFETSPGNRWLIRHLAGALERPVATSFYYAIYNLLPNDTDVTIFKRAGKAAVNFAAVRGVNWYHTPYDDLEHVNVRTLQHHGDNLLATVTALADADLDARSRSDATYFDILGFHLVWWPQEWTIWIGAVSLLLLMFAARRQPPREMTFGVLATFTALLLALLAGVALSMLARARAEGIPFVARPLASEAAMWLAGIAAALLAAALFGRRAQPLPMLYGVAIVWHAIGIVLALTLPGAAFLFIVPGVAVTACALARANETVTSAVAATIGAVLIFPMTLVLYDALGAPLMSSIALLVGALATLVAPLFRGWRIGLVAALLAVACAVAAMLVPPYTRERPRWISVAHVDDRSPKWMIPAVTPELQRVANFTPFEDELRGRGWVAPAPPVAARVTATATRRGEMLTVRVRSPRRAHRLSLILRGDVRVLRVNGVAPPPRPARFRSRLPQGSHMAAVNGVEELVVECRARGRVEAIAGDLSFGLPPAGAAVAAARDASLAIPLNDGDVTITRTRAVW